MVSCPSSLILCYSSCSWLQFTLAYFTFPTLPLSHIHKLYSFIATTFFSYLFQIHGITDPCFSAFGPSFLSKCRCQWVCYCKLWSRVFQYYLILFAIIQLPLLILPKLILWCFLFYLHIYKPVLSRLEIQSNLGVLFEKEKAFANFFTRAILLVTGYFAGDGLFGWHQAILLVKGLSSW